MSDELENTDERTLPPTARRIAQAREQGEVPRSRELAGFVLFATLALALWWRGAELASGLAGLVARGLALDAAAAGDPTAMLGGLARLTGTAVLLVGPILAVLLGAALAGPLLLGGWTLSPRALLPRLARLDPARGLSNLASRRAALEVATALVEAAAILALAAWIVAGSLESSPALARQPVGAALARLGSDLLGGMIALTAGLGLLAAAGVPLALWKHRRRLRMTPRELRRELRETEGDPQVRARMRGRQRDAAGGRSARVEAVSEAMPARGGARERT